MMLVLSSKNDFFCVHKEISMFLVLVILKIYHTVSFSKPNKRLPKSSHKKRTLEILKRIVNQGKGTPMKKMIVSMVAIVALWTGMAWCTWDRVATLETAPIAVLAQ